MSKHVRMFTCALFFVALAGTARSQTPISKLVIFGDSLSDTGNSFMATGIPPGGAAGFPYFNGRFSNGPIWIDFLGPQLGLFDSDVMNFAVGGASTGFGFKAPPEGIFETTDEPLIPTIGTQIELYLATTSGPVENQLTILWGGSNDLFNQEGVSATVNNIDQHVRTLAAAGADRFLVPGLSPIGTTPAVNQSLEGFILNLQVWWLNWKLNRALNKIESDLGVTIHRLETYNLTLLAIALPQVFGFNNTTDDALGDILAGQITPEQGSTYFYWDIIHPTSKVHEVIATAALFALAS